MKILTVHTYLKPLWIGGQRQEGAVTAVTYLDPLGRRSCASLNGQHSQDSIRSWLSWCWKKAK